MQELEHRNGIPVILRTHRSLDKMSEGSMELTEQRDNDLVASEDMISLDVLNAKELTYIAKNLKYSQLLAKLLHGPDQGHSRGSWIVLTTHPPGMPLEKVMSIPSRENGSQVVKRNTPAPLSSGKGSK